MSQCIVTEHEWRDLKGLSDYGMSLSTSSNEAAKMVDALMTQFYRYYEEESLGGMAGTVKHLREADPDYVLGPVFELRFMLLRRRLEVFPELKKKLKEMEYLAKKNTLNEWEKKLVSVMKEFASGYGLKAVKTLKEMVLDNPKDFVALRMAYNFSLILGDWSGMETIMPKVVATWTPDMPLYGYVQGMHGFYLNEFKQRKEAEKYTSKALEINPSDCWSTHSHAHLLLETNRSDEGIKFMEKNESKWTTGKILLQHNYWHWGLFHLDKGDYESVLGVLDNHVIAGCRRGTHFPLTDSSSLLYRLEMEGVQVGKRWKKINQLWNPSEHTWVFEDVHKMINHVGAKDYESANSLLESCRKFAREGNGSNCEAVKDVGVSLCEAVMAYDKAKYDDVVDLLLPIRDDVIRIGGSNAQRDVFNLLLNNSAIKCSSNKHKDLASKLIQERKQWLGEDGLTSRLEERLLERH